MEQQILSRRSLSLTFESPRNSSVDLSRSLVIPGLRVWLSDVDPPHCMAIPSHIFVFTEEEKVKYRDDKFKADGSDLPTVDGLIRRSESSGLGKIHGMGSASNGSDTMGALMEFARAQQSGN
jgi:hypothetical protein